MGNCFLIIKTYLLLFLATIFISSCDNVLDYTPPYTPKMVVNAFFAHDSLFTVAVSKNIPATNIIYTGTPENAHPAITDAIVDVYENGVFIETLPYIAPPSNATIHRIGVYRSRSNRAKNGKNYTLKVKVVGLNDVEASTTIPDALPISNFKFKSLIQNNEKKEIDVQFDLNDEMNKLNYYRVSFDSERKIDGKYIPSGSSAGMTTSDLVLKSGQSFFDRFAISNEIPTYSMFSFPDALFKNGSHTFTLKFIPFSGNTAINPNDRYRIQIMAISEDFYRQESEFRSQALGDSDPFSLPQHVHSNLKGGLGIFASYTLQTYYVQ